MPSKSGAQHRLMEMVAHDPAAAKRLGISQKVGRDFVEADKAAGKHFRGSQHLAKRKGHSGSKALSGHYD